jgi:hypothetical protein
LVNVDTGSPSRQWRSQSVHRQTGPRSTRAGEKSREPDSLLESGRKFQKKRNKTMGNSANRKRAGIPPSTAGHSACASNAGFARNCGEYVAVPTSSLSSKSSVP